jgi:hypothetical protein
MKHALESLTEDRIGPVYGSIAFDDEEAIEPAPND